MTTHLACLFGLLLLAGCAREPADAPTLETVMPMPAMLVVEAEGKLRSSKPVPLLVPGEQWSNRQLTYVLADGSWVKEGDLVARFAAEESKIALAQALIDLRRTQLARAGKQTELGDAQGQLDVDLSQVAGLLGIARRYASATQEALARNKILDAVQDEHFLTQKQDALNWRKGLSSTRGKAELALNDAQRASNDNLVKEKRADLAALELHAPHAGLLVLEANWSGEKPHVGQAMWAGNAFASLPDSANMEVEITLPQSEATSVKEGLGVELAPLGAPQEKILSKISWVAAAAAQRGRDSPVKYLSMKAAVPADAVARHHWAPGQLFRARIVLLQADQALTVPNIALENSGDAVHVSVSRGGHIEERLVHLGVRGVARTQVLDGLQAGDEVVIAAAKPTIAPAAKGAPASKAAAATVIPRTAAGAP